MLFWLKDNTIPFARAKDTSPDTLQDKVIVGEMVNIQAPEGVEEQHRLTSKARKES
jgi:2-oxoglutarate ferredoxin oxidoreductase subunit beta